MIGIKVKRLIAKVLSRSRNLEVLSNRTRLICGRKTRHLHYITDLDKFNVTEEHSSSDRRLPRSLKISLYFKSFTNAGIYESLSISKTPNAADFGDLHSVILKHGTHHTNC